MKMIIRTDRLKKLNNNNLCITAHKLSVQQERKWTETGALFSERMNYWAACCYVKARGHHVKLPAASHRSLDDVGAQKQRRRKGNGNNWSQSASFPLLPWSLNASCGRFILLRRFKLPWNFVRVAGYTQAQTHPRNKSRAGKPRLGAAGECSGFSSMTRKFQILPEKWGGLIPEQQGRQQANNKARSYNATATALINSFHQWNEAWKTSINSALLAK